MPFLNPLVLLGLAAAAIPVLVHLFNFRRPQRMDFPSLRFVRELERKAMRRVRLRQWLLLALRTLAILALVLAFARPLMPSAWREAFGARPPAAVALVVDNSLSMTIRDARGAYIDQAKAVAAALTEAAPTGDAIVLVPTAGPDTDRLSPTTGPVLDAVDELTTRHGAVPVAAAVARAATLLESDDRPRREIYVIGDLQESTWADSAAAAIPEGVRMVLMPVGAGRRTNTAIVDVRVASRDLAPGRPVRVDVTVARFGGDSERVPVRLFMEGEAVAEGAVEVEAGSRATVSLSAPAPRAGWVAGEARLAEEDVFPVDDSRPFVVETPPARRVLLIPGEGRGVEYVRLALSLGAESGAVVANEAAGGRIPVTDLEAYDVVVLAGPRPPAGQEAAALGRFVEAGGGVVVIPHATADPAEYEALFRALGAGRFAGFFGGPDGASAATLGDVDLDHPLLAGLLADNQRGTLVGPDVARALRYTPGGGHEVTVARLSTGDPLLQEVRRGRGASVLLTTAPEPEWSDLASRALFAPLMLRSVDYLAGRGAGGDAQTIIAGRPGTIRLQGVGLDPPITFEAPDGVAVPADAREVAGGVLLDVDPPATAGVYSVRQDGRTLMRVAVQPDSSESDLDLLTPQSAAARLEASGGREVSVLDARGAAGEAALRRRGRGAPLWTYFVALALACLIAETVVATRWKPEGVSV